MCSCSDRRVGKGGRGVSILIEGFVPPYPPAALWWARRNMRRERHGRLCPPYERVKNSAFRQGTPSPRSCGERDGVRGRHTQASAFASPSPRPSPRKSGERERAAASGKAEFFTCSTGRMVLASA